MTDLTDEMERRIREADASISRVLARRVGMPEVGLSRADLFALASLAPADQREFVAALTEMGDSLHTVATDSGEGEGLCPASYTYRPGNPDDEQQPCPECGKVVPVKAGSADLGDVLFLPHPAGRTATRKVAHDSGDGETIFHCPFCGSGQVIGGGDGTTSCDFCGTHFTVQVQPEFAAMPQTVDGTPYPMPGMPGSGTDTAEGADAEDDVDAAQQDAVTDPTAPPSAGPQGAPPGPPPVDAQGQPIPPNVRQQLAANLTNDQFLARYALRHADDRDGVLRRVRALHHAQRES